MPKLRKMLGDAGSKECLAMMRLIDTQNEKTLAAWAVGYAKTHYLPVYEAERYDDPRLRNAVAACEEYLKGSMKLKDTKAALKEAGQIAAGLADYPAVQAAARAVSTACSTVHSPSGALGFLFYGAAASAYSREGTGLGAAAYEKLAAEEFKKAFDSLKAASVADEQNPVKIRWYC